MSVPRLPILQDSNDDCPGGLPGRRKLIDFSQKVSNVSALLLNHSDHPVTYTICDDQGGSQKITLVGEASATISLPENNIRLVGFSSLEFTDLDWFFAIDNVKFTPIDPVWLDPVDSGYLNGGSQICGSCTDQMAKGGRVVSSVAADGVTEAVVRIPANHAGETLNVTVQDENGTACSGQSGVANDGGVFLLGASSGSADCTADVTAVNTTSNGPMAFVVYRSPVNLARSPDDYNLVLRNISVRIQSDDDPNYILEASAFVLRPPVVLVHGLWSQPSDWSSFTPLVNDPQGRFFVRKVDYYSRLVQGVTSTYPNYSLLSNRGIRANMMGFNYNYHFVDGKIREFISTFKHINNAAAVQADVVAHSMGGDIVRTMAVEPGYLNDLTYGNGPIHKLITIGTPHLGTPLATDLLPDPILGDPNECVRNILAAKGKRSYGTVTDTSGIWNGAVADLEGDGSGRPGYISDALLFFKGKPLPFKMAMISATENINNLSSLNCTSDDDDCNAAALRGACDYPLFGIHDPLAVALTRDNWPGVFLGDASDAVVPLNSQKNGRQDAPIAPFDGVVHSAGMEELNFSGPQELDYPLIPARVVDLLNELPSNDDFR